MVEQVSAGAHRRYQLLGNPHPNFRRFHCFITFVPRLNVLEERRLITAIETTY